MSELYSCLRNMAVCGKSVFNDWFSKLPCCDYFIFLTWICYETQESNLPHWTTKKNLKRQFKDNKENAMQLLMLPVQIPRSELIVWRILFSSRFNLHIPCISIPKTCKHKVYFADFRLVYSCDLVVPAYIAIFSWIPALTVRHSDSPSQVHRYR